MVRAQNEFGKGLRYAHIQGTIFPRVRCMSTVNTKVERVDLALVDALARLGVATVHEAQGRTDSAGR